MLFALATFAAAATCPNAWPGTAPTGRAFLVAKAERSLGVYENGTLATRNLPSGEVQPACFPIALGAGGVEGPKREQGDLKTPEGRYRLTHRNPNSSFYKSLGISYPNADDVRASLALGVVSQATAAAALARITAGLNASQSTRMGGEIFLHGMGASSDWTLGCVAVENDVMDYLFDVGNPGSVFLILPKLPAE